MLNTRGLHPKLGSPGYAPVLRLLHSSHFEFSLDLKAERFDQTPKRIDALRDIEMTVVGSSMMVQIRPEQQIAARRGIARNVAEDEGPIWRMIEHIAAIDGSIDSAFVFGNELIAAAALESQIVEC